MTGTRREVRWLVLGPAFLAGFLGGGGAIAAPGAVLGVMLAVFPTVFVLALLGGLVYEAWTTKPERGSNLYGASDAPPLGHEAAFGSS
jgi:hypothetical protein